MRKQCGKRLMGRSTGLLTNITLQYGNINRNTEESTILKSIFKCF